jgi:hypothetical protein
MGSNDCVHIIRTEERPVAEEFGPVELLEIFEELLKVHRRCDGEER